MDLVIEPSLSSSFLCIFSVNIADLRDALYYGLQREPILYCRSGQV